MNHETYIRRKTAELLWELRSVKTPHLTRAERARVIRAHGKNFMERLRKLR